MSFTGLGDYARRHDRTACPSVHHVLLLSTAPPLAQEPRFRDPETTVFVSLFLSFCAGQHLALLLLMSSARSFALSLSLLLICSALLHGTGGDVCACDAHVISGAADEEGEDVLRQKKRGGSGGERTGSAFCFPVFSGDVRETDAGQWYMEEEDRRDNRYVSVSPRVS